MPPAQGRSVFLARTASDRCFTRRTGTAAWLALLAFTGGACGPTVLAEIQPHLPTGWGGRAVALAAHPRQPEVVLVASETGGLFRSTDGGRTFRHVSALPRAVTRDVEFSTTDPGVVIVAAESSFAMDDAGGIWRSTDGGLTFSQPPDSRPPVDAQCPAYIRAYSVSMPRHARSVFVGTTCGVSISGDAGQTWSHVSINPPGREPVYSVLALRPERIVAAAQSGYYVSTDHGETWRRASGVEAPPFDGPHAFAASPVEPQHVFLAGPDLRLYQSVDGGLRWTPVDAPVTRRNRPTFVRASPAAPDGSFTVYYGDGIYLSRRRFQHRPAGPEPLDPAWQPIVLGHLDPSDVLFGEDGIPVLLASDGGVEATDDGGAHWRMVGAGRDGYNALQIYEVTGQTVFGPSLRHHLLMGTQDNSIWSSPDDGVSWPLAHRVDAEGFFLRGVRFARRPQDAQVTGVACWPCWSFIAAATLEGPRAWPPPPDGDTLADSDSNPFPLLLPGHYMQLSLNNDEPGSPWVYHWTWDYGRHWTPVVRLTDQPFGPLHVAGLPDRPVLYQAVIRPGQTDNGARRLGLIRIDDLYLPAGWRVRAADGGGFGGVGLFPGMFPWVPVLAVHPTEPDRLIMADIQANAVKASDDGGRTWYPLAALTSLVTTGSGNVFERLTFPVVTSLAFDPDSRCHVLAGTWHGGIAQTNDGGSRWRIVPGSEQIWNISSFHFSPLGPVFISSYGRGLWRLETDRQGRCDPPMLAPGVPLDTILYTELGSGRTLPVRTLADTTLCPGCELLVVHGGRVTGVGLSGSQIRSVSISSGVLRRYDHRLVEQPTTTATVYESAPGTAQPDHAPADTGRADLAGRVGAFLAGTPAVRALAVRADTLVGVVRATNRLPLDAQRIPYVTLATRMSASALPRAGAGDTVTVDGRGFASGGDGAGPVTLMVDGQTVATGITVDQSGRFRATIAAPAMPGVHVVAALQREGARTDRETAQFLVTTREMEDAEEEDVP
jgi:photosystem II stability/assembly factor-like uncharacterized protein